MTTPSLYELSASISTLMYQREKSQEEDQEKNDWTISMDFEWQLNKLFDAFWDKVENVCKFIRNLEVSSLGLADEIKRIQAIKKQNDNKVDRLKSYLLMIMKAQGLEKYDAGLFKLKLSAWDRIQVNEDGVNLLPISLLKYSVTQEIDLSLKCKLDEMGIETSTMPIWLSDIKKRYKELPKADQKKLEWKIWIDTDPTLSIK